MNSPPPKVIRVIVLSVFRRFGQIEQRREVICSKDRTTS